MCHVKCKDVLGPCSVSSISIFLQCTVKHNNDYPCSPETFPDVFCGVNRIKSNSEARQSTFGLMFLPMKSVCRFSKDHVGSLLRKCMGQQILNLSNGVKEEGRVIQTGKIGLEVKDSPIFPRVCPIIVGNRKVGTLCFIPKEFDCSFHTEFPIAPMLRVLSFSSSLFSALRWV